jgi:PAS domain S-box-containing protein
MSSIPVSDTDLHDLRMRIAALESELAMKNSMSEISEEFPHPVFRIAQNGEILFANDQAKAIESVEFGGTNLLIEDYWKLFVQGLSKDWSIAKTEVTTGETTYSFHCKLHLKQGYFHAFGTDIGDQKSRVDRLLSSFEKFDSAILLEDQHRKIITTNPAFCAMFGIPAPPAALVGADCSNSAEESKRLFKDPDLFVQRITTILKNKSIVINEELELIDGRFLERDYIPVFVNGEYNGHLWKYNDITDRKITQSLLANREKKFQGIINNFRLGLLEVDHADVILSANSSFCKMSGYSEEELKGKVASELFLENVGEDKMRSKIEQRSTGKEDVYEISVKNKAGERRNWLISGAPLINDNGQILGSIGIHWDISDIKQLEAELKKARNDAEEATKNKARFLANMSHEIRTPLNGILGMIEQISKTELDETQSNRFDLISSASQTLLSIVNDILDMSKIEAGKFHLELLPFSIVETLTKINSLLQNQATEKNILLHTSIDASVEKTYIGDAHRICQILFNLVGNSIKFTSIGGVDIHCDVAQTKNKVDIIRISIRDTGIGMDKEFLQRIFGEFEQADTSIAKNYGGSGLGLNITRNLVKLMDGQIRVESELGKGTLVEIKLPLEKSEFKKKLVVNTLDAKIVRVLKGAHVLIADDYPLNRILLKTILEKYEMKLSEVENGQSAVAFVESTSVDLILMDAQMPIMSGIDATRIIRQKISNNIPIIGLSANALVNEVNECLNAGMNEYIIKPYTELEIINSLVKWIEESKKINSGKDQSIDFSILLEYVGNEESLLINVLEAYISFLPRSIERLNKAIANKDVDAVRTELHQLRPNLENLKLYPTKCTYNDLSNRLKTVGLDETTMIYLEDVLKTGEKAINQIREKYFKD